MAGQDAPTPDAIVERVARDWLGCSSMFSMLWHIGRDLAEHGYELQIKKVDRGDPR